MANIKFSEDQWSKAKALYERGFILKDISARTRIPLPNISKKAKAEKWSKANEKQTLIADEVRVCAAKANFGAIELQVHNEIVADQTKAVMFFGNAAVENVREAMAMPCENQNDFRARADTINKGAERVLGKTPDTAIQVNTGAQSQEKIINVVFRGADGK